MKRNDKKIAEKSENLRKFYKIHAFYIDIFQKNVLNKNFENILLKSIQKSLENHEFVNVPCNIYRNLSHVNY